MMRWLPSPLTPQDAGTSLEGQAFARRAQTEFPASAAPSGSTNVGSATLNFGAFPGASDASVNVTGQAGIVSGSKVQAWLQPATTADHTADEHALESIRIIAGDIVAGTGFTIYGVNTSQLNEPVPDAALLGRFSGAGQNPGRGQQRPGQENQAGGGAGTRIYGAWNVAWLWI